MRFCWCNMAMAHMGLWRERDIGPRDRRKSGLSILGHQEPQSELKAWVLLTDCLWAYKVNALWVATRQFQSIGVRLDGQNWSFTLTDAAIDKMLNPRKEKGSRFVPFRENLFNSIWRSRNLHSYFFGRGTCKYWKERLRDMSGVRR